MRNAGRLEAAEIELQRAVKIAEELQFGGPYYELAELRILQKRFEEAEKLLLRCLEIRQAELEPGDASVGETKQRLAEVYEMMGRPEDAARLR